MCHYTDVLGMRRRRSRSTWGLWIWARSTFWCGRGFYSNRTDFIRTAIRNQLATHAEAVRQTVARQTLVLGAQHFSRRDLEAVRDAGERLRIEVLGLASIADDVSPELALETIESVVVLGAFRASPAVKRALADRIG
jgi:Arc/MetJ-type ribon-helix-helix transcriptional regulator